MNTQSPPTLSDHQLAQLRLLENKINAMLPPRYQGCFEDVPPTAMGAAKLKTGSDGQIAWGEIWTTFCHLALAGGPPHRGTLLEPVPAADAEACPGQQQQVVAEIERAICLTTELTPFACPTPGWVGVHVGDANLAAWLVRAIVAENISTQREGSDLFLPAGPHYRVEKEIKNVVTSLAKTCHYLLDHLPPGCRPAGMDRRLVEPTSREEIATSPARYCSAVAELERGIRQVTRLDTTAGNSQGWIGVQCASEEMSVWMMRAVAVEDVLARREGDLLCVPVSMRADRRQGTDRVLTVVAQAHRLWCVHAARSASRA
ncbi:MAG TPA: hypothetical protein VHY91_08620 [Pirellulales bacterium]|jgi:hypothetical protein|nr:hypothetical protein [Pirellulales bacterium]